MAEATTLCLRLISSSRSARSCIPVMGRARPPKPSALRPDSKAVTKVGTCSYLYGGSDHPLPSFNFKLPFGAVVYSRDVTWVHSRKPSALPEPADRPGETCQHLPSGTGIDAAAATAAATAVYASTFTTAATAVPCHPLTGQPLVRAGRRRRAATGADASAKRSSSNGSVVDAGEATRHCAGICGSLPA